MSQIKPEEQSVIVNNKLTKFFRYARMLLVGLVVLLFFGIYLDKQQNKERAADVIVLDMVSSVTQPEATPYEEKPFNVPSDSNASFFILGKSGSGSERTIVTKRVGSAGTTFSKRLYNCDNSTVKYLGTGDSLSQMESSSPDVKMSPIIQGSIAYYVGVEACS